MSREASPGEALVPDQVQANDTRTVTLVEVRAHGVPYGKAQFLNGLCLCVDCMTERVGDVGALRSLFNEEVDLNVIESVHHRTGSYHDCRPVSTIASGASLPHALGRKTGEARRDEGPAGLRD